jgi:hypothetical protein
VIHSILLKLPQLESVLLKYISDPKLYSFSDSFLSGIRVSSKSIANRNRHTYVSWRVTPYYIFQYEIKRTFPSVDTNFISNNFSSVHDTSYVFQLFTNFCILLRFSVKMASVKSRNLQLVS